MRILSGEYKGKKLFAGTNLSIRPITNRLKEVIFAILGDFCEDKHVLDLFCGSGSLGLEALSRGARHITFVEKEQNSLLILKSNIRNLGIETARFSALKSDAFEYSKAVQGQFHLIFVDPPFKYGGIQRLINQLMANEYLDKRGIMIVHHEVDNPLVKNGACYDLFKQKKVGRSLLSFLLREKINVT
jgi:16S rRNA (guanine966-N2)-methyltransferase